VVVPIRVVNIPHPWKVCQTSQKIIPVIDLVVRLIRQLRKTDIQAAALAYKDWALLKMKFGSVHIQGYGFVN
jgi:hypothetical protein